MTLPETDKIQQLIDKMAQKPAFPGLSVSVYRIKDGFGFDGSVGNLANNHPFFIASATKLYITCLILQLVEEGKLQLDSLVSNLLPAQDIQGLHTFKGEDYSNSLTIRHLLSHTSGLPDYFQQKTGGQSLLGRLQSGEDVAWSYDDVLRWTKEMPAKFAPETDRKALYSDSNFQLLGRIIERIEDEDIGAILKRKIFDPLGLSQTYFYCDAGDQIPRSLNFGNAPLDIRKAMTSFRADGSIVSTSGEMMIFLRAFFEGGLFPKSALAGLNDWRRVMFPLQYGVGIMLFATPRIFSPFKKQPELIGHTGLSGAFMFYAPKAGIYLTGTVNQVAKPSASVQLMLRILAAL